MKDFPPKYDVSAVEAEQAEFWQGSDVYQWNPDLPAELDYVIDTPPPTVSGTLHVGHVYSYTQADVIARAMRMCGRNVLYPIGWDDNGLPTERLVEKVRKIRSGMMSREEFIGICNEVIPEYEDQFRAFFSTLALSVDWSREYRTISDKSRAISQLSFLDLYEKGLIDQRLEPSLWDPADQTAIAQAEVEDKPREGVLNEIAFQIEGGGVAPIHIATTRPELLGGCGAVMIHPDHPRAAELLGKNAVTPLYGVPVPFIADADVDPEKGTGAVMCCTFGDVTDIQWYRTYGLPLRIVIDNASRLFPDLPIGEAHWPSVDAALAQKTIAALGGLKVGPARAAILPMLEEAGALIGQTKVEQVIPVAERSGAPIEIIVTPQWFVKTLDYKQQILDKGREVQWHPPHMRHQFEAWVDGLKWDWCISRQRHFGVPIPVWLSRRAGEEGKVLLPTQGQLPVNPLVDLPDGYSRDEVDAVSDVMDTWATSSVTPQMTTGSIRDDLGFDNALHQRLFPLAMRPQAHEIIRTWAFYTIVKALHHSHDVPWKEICISGWCLAGDGTKMSKSKGNIIDPVKLIAEYGVDPIRYWTGTSRLGNDTVLATNTLKQGKRLVNKIWNAARLAHMSVADAGPPTDDLAASLADGAISHPVDIWMMTRLAQVTAEARTQFEQYEYARALKDMETFFWSVYCDNYLELVKWRTVPDTVASEQDQRSARNALYFATVTIAQMFAPFLPYATEKVYDLFTGGEGPRKSVHAMGNWPQIDMGSAAPMPDFGDLMLDAISAVRKIKADLGVSIKKEVETLTLQLSAEAAVGADIASLALVEADLARVLNANRVILTVADPDAAGLVSATAGSVRAFIPHPEQAET